MRPTGETVTIVRTEGGGVDDDGWEIPATRTRTPVAGCIVDDGTGARYEQSDSTITVTAAMVLFPREVTISRTDTVLVRGVEYRIVDEPFAFRPAWSRDGIGGTTIQIERATA